MALDRVFDWRGRAVRWTSYGQGSAVVFCHGTPWSSYLWEPFASALSRDFTVYLWDMPGYGQSSKQAGHDVSLDVQGELLADLLDHWGLSAPHVVAHDIGGAVSLRAHLLHGRRFASLALVDVVALAPWGSDYFRLVREHADVFSAVPAPMHEGALRAYIEGASHTGLARPALDALVAPWLGAEGQAAFYRQIAQADQRHTDQVEPDYGDIDLPVLVLWGSEDRWIPLETGQRLAARIPGAELEVVDGAGHLVHLDQPVALAASLQRWLLGQTLDD
jgi:pimeloyl-ACP methyl ester carboxylesterase